MTVPCWPRLRAVLAEYDTEPVELLMGLTAALWGGWLLLPPETMAAGPIWRVLAEIASEVMWGVLFTAGGLAQTYAVLRDSRCQRSSVAAALFVGWSLVGWGFLLGNPASTAIPTVVAAALPQAWIYIRLARLKPRVVGG